MNNSAASSTRIKSKTIGSVKLQEAISGLIFLIAVFGSFMGATATFATSNQNTQSATEDLPTPSADIPPPPAPNGTHTSVLPPASIPTPYENQKAPSPTPAPDPSLSQQAPPSSAINPSRKASQQTPPPPPPGPVPATEVTHQPEASEMDISDIMVDEIPVFDGDRHWFTFGFIYLPNAGTYFAAGGIRYGYTLSQRPNYFTKRVQDSVALEGGIFVYKALNFAEQSDSYLVYTSQATVRYNLFFSQDFGAFFYAGISKNYAIGTSNQSTDQAVSDLSSFGPALGAGGFFRIGPSWYLRLDLGIDVAALGLVLRF